MQSVLYRNVVASIDILSQKSCDNEKKIHTQTQGSFLSRLGIKKGTRGGFFASTCLTSVRVAYTNPLGVRNECLVEHIFRSLVDHSAC